FEAGAITTAVAAAFTPRTPLLVIDHITAGSALILPVAAIAAGARAAGVPGLGDGAHAPGAIPLDGSALRLAWYSAHLHKWAMAPRSCGFLWVAPERRAGLHPTVISWGYNKGLAAEFDLTGTRDPSPWLAAPAGIDFMRDLGLDAMRAYNHAFAMNAGRALEDHAARIGIDDRHDDRAAAARVLRDDGRGRATPQGRAARSGRHRGVPPELEPAALDADLRPGLQRRERSRATDPGRRS